MATFIVQSGMTITQSDLPKASLIGGSMFALNLALLSQQGNRQVKDIQAARMLLRQAFSVPKLDMKAILDQVVATPLDKLPINRSTLEGLQTMAQPVKKLS